MPAIVPHLVLNDDYQGINVKGLVQTKVDELVSELHEHVDGINAKFASIIIEQITPTMQAEVATPEKVQKWDEPIAKGALVEASPFIVAIGETLTAILKVLRTNMSISQKQIEEEIMLSALHSIALQLEQQYAVRLVTATSKYAKKRIRVDIKMLLKTLDMDASIGLTEEFKQANLDFRDARPSQLKEVFRNILILRCGLKESEIVDTFTGFEAQENAMKELLRK